MSAGVASLSGNFADRVRLVVLLDAAEEAGLGPVPVLRLHMLGYLANVLSPVWDMPAMEGKILKRNGGPFYPILQHELDRLVGAGVVRIGNVRFSRDGDDRFRLEGNYWLNRAFADRILSAIYAVESQARVAHFVRELAYAVSALSFGDIDVAMQEDATYSDPLVEVGNVVDFAEWQDVNYSANAAHYFERVRGADLTPGEKLHLYVRQLHRLIHSDA